MAAAESNVTPNPHHAHDRSPTEPSASDWTSDEEGTESEKQDRISNVGYGWTLFLLVVAILGNLAAPATLDRLLGERYFGFPSQPFRVGSMIEWVFYYSRTAFRSVFFGLWFSEYVAVWLWISSSITSRTVRWLLGLFLCEVISYTVVLGMSIAWGPAPTDFFWFCMIGSLGLYATIHLLLKLLLRRSNFRWQPIQLGSGNRYSIRVLLGTMVGSAVLMLGLKLFPFDLTGVRAKSALDFVPLAIWLAWVALSIATLIWLQLGSIFSPRRGRFVRCFFALAILGPIAFQLIGAWVLAWNSQTRFTIDFEQFLIVYSIEVGLIVGVAMVLPLLPRRGAQSTEHRAQSTEHRAQSTEHRAQSTELRAKS